MRGLLEIYTEQSALIKKGEDSVEQKFVITIGRQFGSGGSEVGYRLAQEMGIPYYDKDLIVKAAKESGINEHVFAQEDEKATGSFLYSLVLAPHAAVANYLNWSEESVNERIFKAQANYIRKVADQSSCVIVGRCADYALEEYPNVLSVFIRADMKDRIRRIAKLYDLTDAKAKDKIIKIDKQRASYYNYYTSKKWGDVASYDLCLNSSVFGINGTVEMLKRAIEEREAEIRPIFNVERKNK